MGAGLSLHIGAVRDRRVEVFAEDARRFAAFARERGFEVLAVLDREVTIAAIRRAIEVAAGRLGPGDTFLLTYSGHGARPRRRVAGAVGDWVLSRETEVLSHAYLERCLLSRFAAGVRVIVVADACFSGAAPRRGAATGPGPAQEAASCPG